jgi:hypothetical protein
LTTIPPLLGQLTLPEAPPVTRPPAHLAPGHPGSQPGPIDQDGTPQQLSGQPPSGQVSIPWLGVLDLPAAPPVIREAPAPRPRPKVPALGLLGLGVILTIGPIAGGLFSKVADGQQLINQFAPHMTSTALTRYNSDVRILRNGATGLNATYVQQDLPTGKFPLLDLYRRDATGINDRAADLLHRVTAAQPEYRQVAAIGGFNRVTFLIVASGLVALYGACVLLFGRRDRARLAAALVVLGGASVIVYPFLSNLPVGASAGERLLPALAPVMTPHEVRQLQRDFIVIVEAVGELETGFAQVPATGAPAVETAALVRHWPRISSDLASLVGVIDDNLDNSLTHDVGAGGLSGLPWLLVGAGAACIGLAAASLPRSRKELS